MSIVEESCCLLHHYVAQEVVGRLVGKYLHLAIEVHTTQSHLLGNIVDAQVCIVHIGVDDFHNLLHQFVIGSLHFKVFHLVFLAFHTNNLIPHYVSGCHKIEQSAP